MITPADSLTVSGTLEPDSTRNSTLHGDESMLKEKIDAQVESVEGDQDVVAQDDDFPDGGLRAWLVVGGVRFVLHPIVVLRTDSTPRRSRPCAAHSQRMSPHHRPSFRLVPVHKHCLFTNTVPPLFIGLAM